MTPADKIRALAAELESVHTGGDAYFTALDARLTTPQYIDVVQSLFDPVPHNVVVTGKFGAYIYGLVLANQLPFTGEFLWFNGGLRHKAGYAHLLGFLGEESRLSDYTFIDDSLYSGKTMLAISGALNQRGDGYIKHVRVVYDGSIVRPDNVATFTCVHRYHEQPLSGTSIA